MSDKKTFFVIKECGHTIAGTWKNPTENKNGYVCWCFHHGDAQIEVPWPDVLHCRYCKKDFTPDQVKKSWLEPVYYALHDHSFNCGCSYIDSSD